MGSSGRRWGMRGTLLALAAAALLPAAGAPAEGAEDDGCALPVAPQAPLARLLQPLRCGEGPSEREATRPPLPCVPVLIADRCHRWFATYDGPASEWDVALSAAAAPDGSAVYVTGYSWEHEYDYATAAYDAGTGDERWLARYDGPGRFRDFPTAAAVSPDGERLYVTGTAYGPGLYNYATLAYDAASGEEVWVATYKGPGKGIDVAYGIATSPDGSRVYVTGESDGGATGYDYATVAYDADTGEQLFARRFTGERNYEDAAFAVGVAPDGERVFVTGMRGPLANFDYATVAYDTEEGNELWVATYGGTREDVATSLGVGPDGVFVTGRSEGPDTHQDYATLAYDAATGARRWLARYDADGYSDVANDLGVSPDGSRVFVTGASLVVEDQYALIFDYDYATLAYDAATGARRWLVRYDGPVSQDDGAASLAVGPSGATVYVTGSSLGQPTLGAFGLGWDAATLAYDAATGAGRWTARYDTVDQDLGFSVVSAGSRVFVTGTSFSSQNAYDYATEAYDA